MEQCVEICKIIFRNYLKYNLCSISFHWYFVENFWNSSSRRTLWNFTITIDIFVPLVFSHSGICAHCFAIVRQDIRLLSRYQWCEDDVLKWIQIHRYNCYFRMQDMFYARDIEENCIIYRLSYKGSHEEEGVYRWKIIHHFDDIELACPQRKFRPRILFVVI